MKSGYICRINIYRDMTTFRKDLHLGHDIALIENDDIKKGTITGDKFSDETITGDKIAPDTIEGRNIAPEAIDGTKIMDNTITGNNIGKGAIQSQHLADESITGDEVDGNAVIPGKIANDAVQTRNIKGHNVTEPKIDDQAVNTRTIRNKAVTPEKLSDNVYDVLVKPTADQINERITNVDQRLDKKIDSVDDRYHDVTDELYSMIASLQVGGIALSGRVGDRTDIGIHQKALTKMLGQIWEELGEITGKEFFEYTFSVDPTVISKEVSGSVMATAECVESISDFDSIKFYLNDELVAESSDVRSFIREITITQETNTIKAVGTIMGKTKTKYQEVTMLYPFFMGGGHVYQDIMTKEFQKELEGTLEGDYDLVVNNDGEHMFIIIPASHKAEFRRAILVPDYDMNGFEIPLDLIEENDDYVVYKTKAENGYLAGTYNIDININS